MTFKKFISNFLHSSVFELYKQPIVPIVGSYDYEKVKNSSSKQYEILLRAVNEDNTRISAYEIIQQAESFGWAEYIDDEVLKRTISYLERRYPVYDSNADERVLYHVNLSGGTINSLGVDALMRIMSRLEESRIDHNQLCFEITETVSIENIKKVMIICKELKNLGCKIALDDFGESLISFDNLKNIQPDYLKIAGKYVLNAVKDKYYEHIIGSITNLCKYLDVKTIGEHVENKAIYELLYELEVDYSQGWYTGYPVPLEGL